MQLTFPSQLTYGKYGMRICTPVSCAVGIIFVSHPNVHVSSALFPPSKIDLIMRRSHELYEERFSDTHQNLLVDDIKSLFPSDIGWIETAGILSSSHPCFSLILRDDDTTISLVLTSLINLTLILTRSKKRVALIVTYHDHTYGLLIDSDTIFKFEPLGCTIEEMGLDQKEECEIIIEYSAMILFDIKETAFFSNLFKEECK